VKEQVSLPLLSARCFIILPVELALANGPCLKFALTQRPLLFNESNTCLGKFLHTFSGCGNNIQTEFQKALFPV